jgi:hypothetical protein
MNLIGVQVDGLNWGVEGHIEYNVLSPRLVYHALPLGQLHLS